MKERRFGFREENLLSPGDALRAYFAAVTLAEPLVEFVSLDDAHGRILARPVDADRDYPDAARSAMDGFAIAAKDAPGSFAIAGEIAMGTTWDGSLPRRGAVRIPTGGIVPHGADAVVPIEDTHFDAQSVAIESPVIPGENVNPRAGDMGQGERVLAAGERIGGPFLGVLATLGVTVVPVFRRPVVAIISSGDELISPGSIPRPGQIRDSNRYAVAGSLRAMGAEPLHYPTVTDNAGALATTLAHGVRSCDAVIVTGGSSVGERDVTPDAVSSLGPPGVVVHGIKVKPGKPTVLGAAAGKPVIGLPGNPTSALVILEAVVSPILAVLTGEHRRILEFGAVLDAPARSRAGWTWFVPVALRHEGTALVAHPLSLRSSMVSLTARADGYLTMGEDDEEFRAGTPVRVRRFG